MRSIHEKETGAMNKQAAMLDSAMCRLVRKTWVDRYEKSDGTVVITPPPPVKDEYLPRCSLGGHPTQFLHFFAAALHYINDNETVPSFCSIECALEWLTIKTGVKWVKSALG